MKRIPPRPNLSYLDHATGDRAIQCIRGESVDCVHMQNGLFVRLDDYNDIKMAMREPFKSNATIPEFSISLAIGALWEGQSFVNILSFRGDNKQRCALYHERRIEAVQCKYTKHRPTPPDIFCSQFSTIPQQNNQFFCAGLFHKLYQEFSRQQIEPESLPTEYSAKTVRQRVRNRVKHYLEERKKRLKTFSGASTKFLVEYAKVSKKLEVRLSLVPYYLQHFHFILLGKFPMQLIYTYLKQSLVFIVYIFLLS